MGEEQNSLQLFTSRKLIILFVLLVIPLLVAVNIGASITDSVVIANSGAILKPVPEPGTPYKWLGIRTSHFGDWYFRNNDTMFREALYSYHPSVWQCQFPGDWWEMINGVEQSQRWSTMLADMVALTKYCGQYGVYCMIVWGNMERADIALGQVFLSKVDEYYNNLKADSIPVPLWWGLDEEWIVFPTDWNTSQIKAQIDTLKTKVEGYGSRFMIAVTRGWGDAGHIPETLWHQYPMWWATNFPYLGWDGPDYINELDQFEQGFGMKIGIIKSDDPVLFQNWTAANIRTIFDHVDATHNMGVIGLDVVTEMLDPTICPDFVKTINEEAPKRGYITS